MSLIPKDQTDSMHHLEKKQLRHSRRLGANEICFGAAINACADANRWRCKRTDRLLMRLDDILNVMIFDDHYIIFVSYIYLISHDKTR